MPPPRISALEKTIGFWPAVAIIVGSMIGSGVFMKPSSMASQVGSPVWLALVWVIAGLFSLFGALIYAELGAMYPETGGTYVFFKKMFGKFVAFLYGWSAFSVINTTAVAAIAFVCAKYAGFFLPLPGFDPATEQSFRVHIPFVGDLYPLREIGVKMLAMGFMVALTALNSRSVKAGSRFQLVSTFVKVAVIAALVLGIFSSGNGSFKNFYVDESPAGSGLLVGGIVAALTGAFFAFDGWINITFIAGEIRDPQRNIPKSLWLGLVACIFTYLLVNQAYLYVMPVEEIAGSSLVASDAMTIAIGPIGGAVVAAMIVICTLGALNGNTMAVSRVTYAMGKEAAFFPWTGREHPRFRTPANALWLHCAWVCALILSGSFDMLADMMVFVSWLAYGMGAVGIFLLRKRVPQVARPYKIWGHPYVTIIFILFTAFFLVLTIVNDVRNYLDGRQPVVNSVLGIIFIMVGIPLYLWFSKGGKDDQNVGEGTEQ